MAVRRFDNALDKLKPDLAKLARDIASQKQKSKGNSTGVAAAMAERGRRKQRRGGRLRSEPGLVTARAHVLPEQSWCTRLSRAKRTGLRWLSDVT